MVDLQRLEAQLLAYAAAAPAPLSVCTLARVLGADPLAVGQALLGLAERGRLGLSCGPDGRFALRALP
jgi:hypothetical protein